MNIIYGILVPEQWERYKIFRLQALKTTPEAFGSSYHDEVLFSDAAWQERLTRMVFAFEEESIVGMVGAVCDKDDTSKVHLISLYVVPEKRGYGVGGKLICYMLEKYAHVPTIELNVTHHNKSLVAYYEKFGFVVSDINEIGYVMRFSTKKV